MYHGCAERKFDCVKEETVWGMKNTLRLENLVPL